MVGDALMIVPSQPGNGVVSAPPLSRICGDSDSRRPRALRRLADDLDVTVAQSRVSITARRFGADPAGRRRSPHSPAVSPAPARQCLSSTSGWGEAPSSAFVPRSRSCAQRAASAAPAEAFQGRLALARFYIANGFGAEALGLVRLMRSSDPALESEPSEFSISAPRRNT